MLNFDVNKNNAVPIEVISSIQQLATQMFQQDMATGAPQEAVQEPQATAPAGGNR